VNGFLRRGVATTGAPPPAADRSGWSALLPPRSDPPRRFTRDGEADAVVIGAGFTGLAAARRLAELRPGWRVVVLEASRAGSGATGRSSGFLVDVTFFTTTLEPRAAERYVRLSRAGIGALRRRALTGGEDGIDCDWDDTGWIHAAAGEPGLRDLGSLRRWLEDRGEPYTWLDGAAMGDTLGTPFYRAGIRLPGRPLVQPSALARGLAAGLPGGVELYEGSPVRRMEAPRRTSSAWRLAVGDAILTAPRVLAATNGYTPSLGFLGGRVFPLLTFGSLTRPLTPAEGETLGGELRWGLLAQDAMGSSLRRTGDGRLLVRNTVAFSRSLDARPAEVDRAREAHRDALARRFPSLYPGSSSSGGAVELEHTWTGVMGATPSRRFFFGRVAEGLWATAGFTGAGIAQGTIAGALLADLACGEDSRELRDMLALPAPGRLPPRPFQDVGIRWRVARMNAGAGETL
jgi:glycine/D-amino acid oxidase-like deaminating enzyme